MNKRKLTDEQRLARKRMLDKANQDKRNEELNAKARAAGYTGKSEFDSMVLRGEVELPPCPRKEKAQ